MSLHRPIMAPDSKQMPTRRKVASVEPPGELEVKAEVLNFLRQQRYIMRDSVVASELRIVQPALRADLAILTKEHFIGIEIKSEVDSLRRLPSQVSSYLEVFDHVIIVLATKHLKSLDRTLVHGADLWSIEPGGAIDIISTAEERRPTVTFTSLMTQAEVKRFVSTTDLFQHTTQPATPSEQRSAERANFSAAFTHRFGATSEQFWRSVGRRTVRPSDLLLLSRFHPRRQRQRQWQEAQTAFWREWTEKAEGLFGTPRQQVARP